MATHYGCGRSALAVKLMLWRFNCRSRALLGGMEPDGTSLASGSEDGAVWAWRLMDVNSMRLAIRHLTNKHDWVLNEREILLSGGPTALLEMEPSRMPSEISTAEGRAAAEGCGCSAICSLGRSFSRSHCSVNDFGRFPSTSLSARLTVLSGLLGIVGGGREMRRHVQHNFLRT